VQHATKAAVDELIGGEHLAGEVAWQEERGDDDATEHVTEDDLQETEVSREGNSWNGDDGERGGLCRDDGERDCPPWNRVAGKEVALERAVGWRGSFALAEAQSEERNANQIDCDKDQVGSAEACQARCREGEYR